MANQLELPFEDEEDEDFPFLYQHLDYERLQWLDELLEMTVEPQLRKQNKSGMATHIYNGLRDELCAQDTQRLPLPSLHVSNRDYIAQATTLILDTIEDLIEQYGD